MRGISSARLAELRVEAEITPGARAKDWRKAVGRLGETHKVGSEEVGDETRLVAVVMGGREVGMAVGEEGNEVASGRGAGWAPQEERRKIKKVKRENSRG
jgi:hypothetical protein